MTNLRSLSDLFRAAMKLAAACAFMTAIAAPAFAQTPTNVLESTGNAGIGTTTPAYPLTVNQTGNSVNKLVGLANDSSGSSAQSAISFFEGATEKFKFGMNSSGATGYVGGANAFQLWHFQNAPIVFGTNSVERIRIDGGGNLGIGTTTPSQKLNVIGNGLFGNLTSRTLLYSTYDSQQNPFLEVGNGTSHSATVPFPFFVLSNHTTSTSNAEGIIGQIVFANRSIADNNDKRTAVITSWVDGASNSGTLQFYTSSAGAVAERLRITSAGNVGIGTTTPQTKFDIKQSSDTFVGGLHLRRSSTNDTWALVTGADNSLYMGYANNASGADAASDFTVYPLVLSSSGNVGIGATAPVSQLHVAGLTPRMNIQDTTGGGSNFALISRLNRLEVAIHGVNTIASFLSSGNVGIGTTTPGYKLDVAGEIRASSGGFRFPDGSLQTTAASGGGGGGTAFSDITAGTNTVALVVGNGGSFAVSGTGTINATSLTNAANITGGTVPITRLGTGTPDSTNFLRGDNTWTAITSSQWANGSGNINYTTGNVGIGTAVTSSKLGVLSNDSTANGVSEILRLSHNTTGTPSDGIGSRIAFTAERASGIEVFTGYIDSILTDATNVDSALLFHTRDNGGSVTERVRIDSVGNVGIGVTIPNHKLDVQGGQINSSGGLCIAGDCKTAWSQVGGGGSTAFSNITAGTNTVALVVGNGGSFGVSGTGTINATSLANAANITSGTVPTARLGSGTANNTTFLRGDNTWAALTGGSTAFSNITAGTNTVALVVGPNGSLGVSGTGTINATSLTNAANITSGTVPTARLGTGTANNTTFLRGDNTWAALTSSQWTTNGSSINYAPAGNVGIGVTGTPAEKLHVVGNGKITGNLTVDGTINAKYQDLAEWVPSSEQLSAGTVVVLDTTKSNQVISSGTAYDTRVAGVISAQPGITLGEGGEGKVLVATTGRVRVKVDASRGAIQIGDLLVTSDVLGVAMKSEPVEFAGRKMHMPGTIIGKALEPLAKGSGEILVLLSLQ